jgi:hypothetical protein
MGRRSLRRLAPALTLGVAVVAGACGGKRIMGAQLAEPFATVIIDNDATLNVTVYAVQQGSRVRLGQVTALQREEFRLEPRHLTGTGMLQLMIDPLGSPRQYYSDRITVYEGDVVELRVSGLIR